MKQQIPDLSSDSKVVRMSPKHAVDLHAAVSIKGAAGY